MEKILIFAGTKDGRVLAEHLCQFEKEVHISVATEYGEEVLPKDGKLYIHRGRLKVDEMESWFQEEPWSCIIDATHPYAVEVSKNIKKACEITGRTYIRLLREKNAEDTDCIYVNSKEEAAEYLNRVSGNILFTTGSKELEAYVNLMDDISRMYVRILTDGEMVLRCRQMGLAGKQIICMQGPFSADLNAAMLKQLDAKYLVTKDTGVTGGFPEKLEGAKKAGVKVIVIRRPGEENGYFIKELLEVLGVVSMPTKRQKITLMGIGMGDLESMTIGAYQACQEADVILGSSRMIQSLEHFRKPMEPIYQAQLVKKYVEKHPEFQNIVVAFSGDVGFYSGTSQMLEVLDKNQYEVELICGISSPVYAASRFGMPWQDMKLMSIHGRMQNVIAAIRRHEKVFTLAGSKEGIREFAGKLLDYGLDDVIMHVGYQLSYTEETLLTGKPEDFLSYNLDGLSVVIIENKEAKNTVITHGLPDEIFIRGKAPMTKEEIRSISLSKLALTKNAIVYDVGAGTGSVGIECALQAVDGKVYAIEKKEDALELLENNKKQLGTENLEIIAGIAPEAMKALPAPTHAFIGGSSGNMAEIVNLLLEKNPKVRIVINGIAMETVAEVMQIMKIQRFEVTDIAQIFVGKSKILGNYHMMMGQNPVYIFTLQKEI